MADINILSEIDLDRFYQLYLASFNYKNSTKRRTAFDIRFRNAIVYGYKIQERLVGGLWSLPFMINFHNVKIPMEGIGVVMTSKDHQGEGIAGEVLKSSLNDMYQRKTQLSYLAPFSYPFYRKFGYEQVFTNTVYSVDVKDLPKVKNKLSKKNFRSLELRDAIPDLKYYYENIVPQNKGGLVRPDWWWDYLGVRYGNLKVVIYYIEGRPSSYIVYQMNEQNVNIYEWQNDPKEPSAFLHLFAYISTFMDKVKKASYVVHSSYYLASTFADPSVITANVKPYMMARIVNFEEFAKSYPFERVFNVNFNLNDPVIAENSGNWQLSYDGKEIKVKKNSAEFSKNTDFDISIQQLTKLMMGGTRFAHSVRIGKIKNNTPNSYEFVKALQTEEPEIIDYF